MCSYFNHNSDNKAIYEYVLVFMVKMLEIPKYMHKLYSTVKEQ